jgi:hypothetical protein
MEKGIAKSRNTEGEQALQRLSEFYSLAHDFLGRAAEYDAKGFVPDAITHFKKGAPCFYPSPPAARVNEIK